jgi:hypothetical protein
MQVSYAKASDRTPLRFEEQKRGSEKEFPMAAIPSKMGILIVGAGPTGLALSAELGRRGFEPLTVDKIAEGANTSFAGQIPPLKRAVARRLAEIDHRDNG